MIGTALLILTSANTANDSDNAARSGRPAPLAIPLHRQCRLYPRGAVELFGIAIGVRFASTGSRT